MDVVVSLVLSSLVFLVGLFFALWPRWGMKVVCRCARSYMAEDLTRDAAQVLAFRFYGGAAAVLGIYALYQVLQAF